MDPNRTIRTSTSGRRAAAARDKAEDPAARDAHAWYRTHLAYGGPRKHHDRADEVKIAGRICEIRDQQEKNEAVAHFTMSGFPKGLLPKRVPIRRRVRCEGWDDEAKTVEAWDVGGQWNGWAMPLVTHEVLMHFVDLDDQITKGGDPESPCFDLQGYDVFFRVPHSEDEPSLVEMSDFTTPDGAPLYNVGDLGLCWVWEDAP